MYGYNLGYAAGGIASLANKGRYGDTMLVHMSPQEVIDLQRLARSQGTTMTLNPETGLPEAFKLRKLLGGIARVLPIAAAFVPPLAAAMPFLTTPMGAALAGGLGGGLSGDKGFDVKRGLTSGLLSYGIGSAMQGLQAAGGASATGGDAASQLAAQEAGITGLQGVSGSAIPEVAGTSGFTASELAKLSPQARAAVQSSIAPTMGTASQGISNLLAGDAATRAAAQQAFLGQFGKGAMLATGAGLMGGAALDEQERMARDALAAQKISKQQYDEFMKRIEESRERARYSMQQNPWRLQKGGAIDTANKPVSPYPVKFYGGGDGDDGGGFGGDDGGFGGDDGGGFGGDDGGLGDSGGYGVGDDGGFGGFGGNDLGDSGTYGGGDESGAAFGGDYGGLAGGDYGGMTDSSAMAADDAALGASMAEAGGFGDTSAMAMDDAALGQAMAEVGGFDDTSAMAMDDMTLGQDMANAVAAMGTSADASPAGPSEPPIPFPILLDNPFIDKEPKKKTWDEMTEEEKEEERRRYYISKYPILGWMQNSANKSGLASGGIATLNKRHVIRKAVGGEIDSDYRLTNPEFGGKSMQERNVFGLAKGGVAALPPRYINGPGDGMSDSVPAVISNKQPARLADGEFVIPADVVSHLGNGSTKAGAQQLYAMMDRVRKARTGRTSQGKQIRPTKYLPS